MNSKYTNFWLWLLVLTLFSAATAQARENNGLPTQKPIPISGKTAAACSPATASIELNVNNVRTRLLSAGDMWWNLQDARYEVPKVEPGSGRPSIHSLFAGALWIGGIDALGQLKVAAQTYRQTGNDFWPGPLDDDGNTNDEVCGQFDRFWEVRSKDIDDYLALVSAQDGGDASADVTIPAGSIPLSILKWPGRNNAYADISLPEDKNLAPFWDRDGDNDYDPTKGDYPVIDSKTQGVYADQMIWWVFNDKGDVHSETGGEAIGLQLNALAFAFATNDEVNNMTFYKYGIENKATQPLDSVFFGQWVDPDLGNYGDDYVGCVPSEGIGIVYNGDANDELYGANPPMLCVDFFKGPRKQNGVDKDGNPTYEILNMSAFVYYNNDWSVIGNPEIASHFYGYLAGVWKDGSPFTCGGNAYGGTDNSCDFMFPSDPTLSKPAWSECSENNKPADRRFLQSAGPFRLDPGAFNEVIVGVVWIPGEGLQYPCPSFDGITRADKKAQALFDNNFKLKDGPDAPNVFIRELNRELILTIYNDSLKSNNAFELYQEIDPVLAKQGFPDSTYNFQGYVVYQLKSPLVSASEYNDPDKARIVEVVDIKDDVTRLINWSIDGTTGFLVPELKVDAKNSGIKKSFRITEDLFATGDKRLTNNLPYYFSVKSYSYNAHEPYKQLEPSPTAQFEPYLEGRGNIGVYVGVPHIEDPQFGGVEPVSIYGDGPEITAICGKGNGGNAVQLTETTVNEILASPNHIAADPVYQSGAGPIDVKVVDPLSVKGGTYELSFQDNIYPSYSQPQNGTIQVDQNTGILTYTPKSGFEGFDYFTYEVSDVNCNTDIGFVRLEVGTAKIDTVKAYNDTYSVEWIAKIEADVSAYPTVVISPMVNDVSTSANTTITAATSQHGTIVSIDAVNKTIKYRAKPAFIGIDRITYTIENPDAKIDSVSQGVISVDVYKLPYLGFNAVIANDDMVAVPANASTALAVRDNDTGDIQSDFLSPFARWTLTNIGTGDTWKSESNIKLGDEQLMGGLGDPSLGFTISMRQQPQASGDVDVKISAGLRFENNFLPWMSMLNDGEGTSITNWVRSGDNVDENNDASYADNYWNPDNFYDPQGVYESILGGTIAPYCLVNNQGSDEKGGRLNPACSDCLTGSPTYSLDNMASVEVVFTDNKALWTKCVVTEMARTPSIADGKAVKNSLRNAPSWEDPNAIDGNGKPVYASPAGNTLQPGQKYYIRGNSSSYITYTDNKGATVQRLANNMFIAKDIDQATSATLNNNAELFTTDKIGYSWFPGYAINHDTGERLNLIFSENSFFISDNGKDMIWNPSTTLVQPGSFSFKLGGEHFVYVMNSRYDGGQYYHDQLVASTISESPTEKVTLKNSVWKDGMWVFLPYGVTGFELKSLKDGLIPTKTTVSVNVARPYELCDDSNELKYRFNLDNYVPKTNQKAIAEAALDKIRIVPNPYYAYSAYEQSQLDNRVRITNLPNKANINIITVDGTLVRTIKVDNGGQDTAAGDKEGKKVYNSVDWDMKNFKGVPIASGIYLIHIEAPDLGKEVTLKWFCITRPIDLDIF
ncbi:MAG: hypothetical protein IPI59_01520 [Sphingobacteriales bacterium]|nr:hypothetical protein [Sphingobacteriales bacterium]MBK7526249.1 hypothetical protein [Sphingobacteriales bacterium]MBL0247156.1 hypothetical protein [Sphingobacteriales bacterium]